MNTIHLSSLPLHKHDLYFSLLSYSSFLPKISIEWLLISISPKTVCSMAVTLHSYQDSHCSLLLIPGQNCPGCMLACLFFPISRTKKPINFCQLQAYLVYNIVLQQCQLHKGENWTPCGSWGHMPTSTLSRTCTVVTQQIRGLWNGLASWLCQVLPWLRPSAWLESDYVYPGLPQILGFLLPQSPKWSAGITDILQYPVRKCSIYDNLQFPQPGPQSSSIYYSLLDSNVTCTFSEIFGIETDSLLTSNSLLSLNCPVMTQCHSPGNLMIKRNWLVLGFRGQELWDQGAGIWRMPSCHAIPRQKVKG